MPQNTGLQFLERLDPPQVRKIACLQQQGRGPTIVWLGGFRSDMMATKAEAIATWGQRERHGVLRFDYTGHGQSGGHFADATISIWLADTLAVIEHAAGPAPILVGSSMGGWLALLAALALKAKGTPFPALC